MGIYRVLPQELDLQQRDIEGCFIARFGEDQIFNLRCIPKIQTLKMLSGRQ